MNTRPGFFAELAEHIAECKDPHYWTPARVRQYQDETKSTTPEVRQTSAGPCLLPPAPCLSPRRVELRRLTSEAKEMQGRWGGLRALLERIERNDTLEDIGGELEAIASAHNGVQTRWEETRAVVGRLWALVLETSEAAGRVTSVGRRTDSGQSLPAVSETSAAPVGTDCQAVRSETIGAPSGRALPELP